MTVPEAFLAVATVDEDVFALCPDYRALLVVVDGITPTPSDDACEELLLAAETHAAELLAAQPVDQLPHVEAWRTAYRALGAKPQRTRNSLEALTRRAAGGLPRVNRLTDIYNAVSVLIPASSHQTTSPAAGGTGARPAARSCTRAPRPPCSMDALAPMTDDALQAAADDLVSHLAGRMPSRTWRRWLCPGG